MAGNKGRTGAAYRRLREQVRREEGTRCWLCPLPIDLSLKYHGGPGDMSFSLDHVVPLEQGGSLLDRSNARAAHLDCNRKRRDNIAQPKTSRKWLV
ncbi:HNH endonuclease [Euzebya sp.]|uniref:HNH endonuclease n=1 Tax=Euzebya sp. TaxID=1971409 RepID=UPI0035136369